MADTAPAGPGKPEHDATLSLGPGADNSAGPTAQLPSATVGRFELRRLLGEGAFGRVYEAHDPVMKRAVALKVARPEQVAERRWLERFLREARAAGLLTHPNIVAVFDSGSDGGRHFIASALVKGRPLDAAIKKGPLRPREAAKIARKLAAALAYAHREGVIHRDVKPSNVMLRDDGEPLLMDFGLAARADDAKLTQAGQFMGTPAYCAPEQWVGEATQQSDQYSLGCLLFELLTGKPPFVGPNVAAYLSLHARARVPQMPGVPRDLETITRKCLEKDQGRRYGDCGELADDLGRFLDGEPTKARPVGPFERLWRWAWREPLTAGLAGLVLVVLLAGIVASSALAAWAMSEAGASRLAQQEAKQREQQAREAEALAKKQKEEADFQALRAETAKHAIQIDLALRAWRQNDLVEAERVLAEVQPRFRQSWETRAAHGLCRQTALTLTGHTSLPRNVAFSPDGIHVASGDLEGMVRVWDTRTSRQALFFIAHKGYVGSLAYSPDGRRIVTGGQDNKVIVWDAGSGKPLLTLKGHTGPVQGVAHSPDGTRIASASRDGTVRTWDARTGAELLTLKGHVRPVFSVAFSPDGKTIASAGEQAALLWDASTGRRLITIAEPEWITGLAFSPDGKRIATGCPSGTVKAWDASAGRLDLVCKGRTSPIYSVAYSPDGRLIASASKDGTVRAWDAQAGQEVFAVKGHTDWVPAVAFSPDGSRIASCGNDQKVRVYRMRAVPEWMTVRGHKGEVWALAYSPDGKRIATGGQDLAVRVWRAHTGQEELILRGHTQTIKGVAFSPDGSRLASCAADFMRPRARAEVKAWWLRQVKEALPLEMPGPELTCAVAYSPDGKRLATGGGGIGPAIHQRWGEVRVYDAEKGQQLLSFRGHTGLVIDLAYSPDGKRIATAGDKTVKLWDAHMGTEALSLEGHTGYVLSVAFSPDGKRLVSGASDCTLRLWDAETGREVLALSGHTRDVTSVAFSRDGTRIVSGSSDHTARVWDTRTGQQMLALKGHTAGVHRVAFAPDGERIASAGDGGSLLLWGPRGRAPEHAGPWHPAQPEKRE